MTQSLFDSIKHLLDSGEEVWYARELYPLLGYTNWNKFQDVISRAKDAIAMTHDSLDDHFYHMVKMVI